MHDQCIHIRGRQNKLICLSACLLACLYVCLPVCLFAFMSVCLSVCLPLCLLACLCVALRLSVAGARHGDNLSGYFPVFASTRLKARPPARLSISLSAWPRIQLCMLVHLPASVCPSPYLSINQSVCLCAWLSMCCVEASVWISEDEGPYRVWIPSIRVHPCRRG